MPHGEYLPVAACAERARLPFTGSAKRPKLRWFQFHLLTAVVVMLVAGAWMGANFLCDLSLGTSTYVDSINSAENPFGQLALITDTDYGLPWRFVHTRTYSMPSEPPPDMAPHFADSWQFYPWGFVLDLLVMLALLAATFVLSELLIRGHAATQERNQD